MTKDNLIQMADLAGYDVDDDDDVYAPAEGRYGLDPRLEHFARLVAKYVLRYECRDVSTKPQNVDTSEKCVQETDKSIHEPWVSLTDEEIENFDLPDKPTVKQFVRFVEAALRSKNT